VFNVSKNFELSEEGCLNKAYRITKVQDSETGEEIARFEKVISINSAGILTILDSKTPRKPLLIFI
jgi:hypothetical protein